MGTVFVRSEIPGVDADRSVIGIAVSPSVRASLSPVLNPGALVDYPESSGSASLSDKQFPEDTGPDGDSPAVLGDVVYVDAWSPTGATVKNEPTPTSNQPDISTPSIHVIPHDISDKPIPKPKMSSGSSESEIDRNERIYCEELQEWFPAHSTFDDPDPLDEESSWYYFAQAPWFRRDVCTDHRPLLDHYGEDGILPGGIPVDANATWTWRNHMCYENENVHDIPGRTFQGVVGEMAIIINQILTKFFTWTVPDETDNVSMFLFRTSGEENYVANLKTITNRQLER